MVLRILKSMLRPWEIARSLGASPTMIEAAHGHWSWEEYWQSINNGTWLAYYLTQVPISEAVLRHVASECASAVSEIGGIRVDSDEGDDHRQPAAFDGSSRRPLLVDLVRGALEEVQVHRDALVALLSSSRTLLLSEQADPSALAGVIRSIVDVGWFMKAVEASPWLRPHRPNITATNATFLSPLIDGRQSVRSTPHQQLWVVEDWLVIARLASEIHHPMRHVKRIGFSRNDPG